MRWRLWWRTICWFGLLWSGFGCIAWLRLGCIAGLRFGCIAGFGLGCIAGPWLGLRRRSIAGPGPGRLGTRTVLLLRCLRWRGLVGWLGRRWWWRLVCRLCWWRGPVGSFGRLWRTVGWLGGWWRRPVIARGRLALRIALLWRLGGPGGSGRVHHVDGRRVVRLVDQHRQLVVGQGHVLHCRRGRVLAAVSTVRVGGLGGRGEVDDGGLLSGVDDGAAVLDLRLVGLLRRPVGLRGRGSLVR